MSVTLEDDELCFLSATELAPLISRRALSPVELMDAVLCRAERLQPVLNLFVTPLFDEARDLARQAEAAVMRGDPVGPLHGIPVTVKDNVALAGVPMFNGSVQAPPVHPTDDGIVAARLKAAGAIVIGTTTLPEFAHKVLTDSPLSGVTPNPWNLSLTPGGSSGGASAALAAGVAPIAIGTDGGGSIRCPAACTGVSGLKAGLGRIPFEQYPDSFSNHAFIGPMTRSARDLPVMLAALAGPHPTDPYSAATGPFAPRPAAERFDGLRIGWIGRFGQIEAKPETAALTRGALDLLTARGATVTDVSTDIFDDVFDYYVVIATTAHAARLSALAEAPGSKMTPSLITSVHRGQGYSAADWQRASDRRTRLHRNVQHLFESYDVIATPTMTGPSVGLDAGGSIETAFYARWAGFLYPFNLTGHPALSTPAGFTAEGLPVGVQLVGRYLDEQRLIDLAVALEADGGWISRKPKIG